MSDRAFFIVFGIWVLLGAAGSWLFYVNRNVRFKRKYFPWYASLAGTLFVAFVAVTGFPLPGVACMVPVVALITYMNIRGTQFCDACGRTVIQQSFFSRPKFCPKCGAPFGATASDHA